MSLPHRPQSRLACPPAQLPEELRLGPVSRVSSTGHFAAGGRVWRDQETDGSPLPPLPNRFRCCCLGNEK